MDNGIVAHFYGSTDNLDSMKKYEEECKKAYEADKSLRNKLNYVYAKTDRMQAEGMVKDATEYLLAEINDISVAPVEEPYTVLRWMDTLSLAAELLIRLKRPEEALRYADKVYSIAIEQFEDSVELIYASELYGVCLQVCKRYDEAKECYAETLKDIDYEITNLERLRQEITTNLEEMSK